MTEKPINKSVRKNFQTPHGSVWKAEDGTLHITHAQGFTSRITKKRLIEIIEEMLK